MKRTQVLTLSLAAGLAVSGFLTPETAAACAGCRNPSLASARASGGYLPAGEMRGTATLSGTHVAVVHPSGCVDVNDCDQVPVQPEYLHDQTLLPLEFRLGVEYGFHDSVGIELQLPVRSVTTGIEFTTPEGEPYEPPDADVHHRNETIAGLTDPLLLARFSTLANKFFLAVRVGVSVPLGSTEKDPYELGERGIRHQHIQLGTGTFDPTLALEASHFFDPINWQWFAQTSAALYENRHGYQAPFRVQSGFGGTGTLVSDLSGGLSLGVFHETAEHWQGVARQDASLGRTEAYAEVSLSQLWEEVQFGLNARFPLYRHIIEGDEPTGSLSSPLAIQLSVSRAWDLDGD